MKPREEFEIQCYEFLKRKYGDKFHREGGMDSTKSDIAVIKNNCVDFFIEAKDTAAQSGQFVLLPDEDTKTFVFSPRNHSDPNEMSDIMIEYMNQDFERFNSAGTAGESLDIDSNVFSNWIIGHYMDKNVKYVISYKNGYVILPIRKFAEYFDISATYRIKKSGSGKPAKKDIPEIIREISKIYPTIEYYKEGKSLIVCTPENVSQKMFSLGKYTYLFSKQDTNTYEIRKLSNTYNMNVIFSIWLKRSQDLGDLREFEWDL
ncbi:MAG: hypothetical protein ACI4JS_06875 [Oscillospiraceae bacterium]